MRRQVTPVPTYKVMVTGPAGCGKTQLTKALCGESFDSRYVATFGVDVDVARCGPRGQAVLFNLWDLAGDLKFKGLETQYWLHANVVLVCFDVTKPELIEPFEDKIGNAIVWLVALKSDLPHDPVALLNVVARFEHKYPIVIISSKTGSGVKRLLDVMRLGISAHVHQAPKL